MRYLKHPYLTLFLALGLIVLFSCEQETFYKGSDAKLEFSVDTITFDTVFTTIGSTTQRLKVYNPYKQPVKINTIYLAGSDKSYFRLNIDGERAVTVKNIELEPKDSLYIFVEVTVDPTAQNSPVLISDSIVFETNGNIQDVNLEAWGQDVHFIRNEVLNTQVWRADKPYLIYDTLLVNEGQILTITAGTKIYLHKDAQIIILGTLRVLGSLEEPVIFRGDRLDNAFINLSYDKVPGQWGFIWLHPVSKDNIINHCIIKNGIIGLLVGNPYTEETTSLILNNSIIDNHSFVGIYAINALINATNCQISNCKTAGFICEKGGYYNFLHTTFANYFGQGLGGQSRDNTPSIILKNYVETDSVLYLGDLKKASFRNSIIYGSAQEELAVSGYEEAALNFKFENCILRTNVDSIPTQYPDNFIDVIFNEDPNFIDPEEIFFDLDTLSPAKDVANIWFINESTVDVTLDLKGNSRIADGKPDLGAYERIEPE